MQHVVSDEPPQTEGQAILAAIAS